MITGLNHAHIVKVSEEEVEFLTGGHDITPLWRDEMQIIAVTRGAEGSTIYTRKGEVHVPGFSVKTVDTTGAGDGFMAGLLVGILENRDEHIQHLEEIARSGKRCRRASNHPTWRNTFTSYPGQRQCFSTSAEVNKGKFTQCPHFLAATTGILPLQWIQVDC
ncbi:MAG: PfkB family carbohydrate kinase [Anaerolineae bacterium]